LLFQVGELLQRFGVLRRRYPQRLAALGEGGEQVTERAGVLTHQERHFRVDDVGTQHGVGVLREPLRQHDELAGDRDLARRSLRLQLERLHLLGEVEQRRVVVVDRAHRGSQPDQVLLLGLDTHESQNNA